MGYIAQRGLSVVAGVCLCLSVSGCLESEFESDKGFEILNQKFSAAWQKADAHAIADLFTPDATVVGSDGHLVAGRAAIETFYRAAFAGTYTGSRVDSTIKRTYRLRQDIAIIDGEWHIFEPAGRTGRADERGILCVVLTRAGRTWSIAALREQAGATTVGS